MKIINKYITLIALVTLLGVSACEVDDATGHSTMVPTSPSISVTGAGSLGSVSEDAGTTFTIDLTMSVAQTVDVAVYVTQTKGDATWGEDFVLSADRVIIPAYRTSASFDVTIMNDDLIEDSESFTLQIGDDRTANASISPVTADITITSFSSADLTIDMSWDIGSITDVDGSDLSASAAVDLRLLVVDYATAYSETTKYSGILGGADGGSFESYTLANANWADGTYYVVADFYDAIDLGDQGYLNLDLALELNQPGVINGESYSFEGALNTINFCSDDYFVLGSITKSGSSWSFASIAENLNVNGPLAGSWTGDDINIDALDWQMPATTITTLTADNELTIDSLGYYWMYEFWGEEVLSSSTVIVDVTDVCGSFEIPEQDYIITLYDGAEYPYTIEGYGTFDMSGSTPVMHVEYDMIQEGFSTAGWTYDNGYMSTPLFVADIVLTP